jgi:hypothetical protein
MLSSGTPTIHGEVHFAYSMLYRTLLWMIIDVMRIIVVVDDVFMFVAVNPDAAGET